MTVSVLARVAAHSVQPMYARLSVLSLWVAPAAGYRALLDAQALADADAQR